MKTRDKNRERHVSNLYIIINKIKERKRKTQTRFKSNGQVTKFSGCRKRRQMEK